MKFILVIMCLTLAVTATAQKNKPAVKKKTATVKKTTDTTGMLSGRVKITGLCPQEPCNPTPTQLAAAYKSLELVITQPEKKWVGKYNLSDKGTFSIKLPAGTYNILVNPKEGSAMESRITTATVEGGKTKQVVLEYNTGLQ